MAKVKLYNQEGNEISEIELSASLFGVKVNPTLIHYAVVAQQANTRQVLAHTKGRGEVRGGGRKPWRQKGTGHARHGSIRSPIWVGGGVTFGPTKERNFKLKINRSERRKALAMALSDKAAGDRLIVVDSFVWPEIKTKAVAALIKKLPVGKKVLMVIEPQNKTAPKAARNIKKVSPISAQSINLVDILSHDTLVVSRAAIEVLEKVYAG